MKKPLFYVMLILSAFLVWIASMLYFHTLETEKKLLELKLIQSQIELDKSQNESIKFLFEICTKGV